MVSKVVENIKQTGARYGTVVYFLKPIIYNSMKTS